MKHLHGLCLGIILSCIGISELNGQSCQFNPLPTLNFSVGGICTNALSIECPNFSIPDCGCIADPNAPPTVLENRFTLNFDSNHLLFTPIVFPYAPSAACADVTITMRGIGDMSSRPFEDMVLVDENDSIICRLGGADCEIIQTVCIMSFCDFNGQLEGGLNWYLLPNSLFASPFRFPRCQENWLEVKLEIPSSSIRAISDLTDECGGIINLPIGDYTINWRSIDRFTCEEIFATQAISIRDNIPPVIMGCPAKSPVTINLGPGECGAFWDAPPFVAMDDCPGGIYFSAQSKSVGCMTPFPRFASVSGVGWGYMFDIRNASSGAINIQGFESWFKDIPQGPPTGLYEFWYKTNADESWKTGYVGALPTNGCNFAASSPVAIWTLGKASVAGQIRQTSWQSANNAASIDTFDFSTRSIVPTVVCGTTRFDTVLSASLTLQPGETRGIFITSAPGTFNGISLGGFGSCSSIAGYGDANLRIAPSTVAPNSIIINRGAGANLAGTTMCATFGVQGNFLYASPNNLIPLIQTCGAPYGPGCFFPIGCTRLCYMATDAAGNVATCEFQVCVNAYPFSITELACNDDIQISLDDSCFATITADMVLEGGPYRCYDEYRVEVRDWITNILIDRRPNVPGSQIGFQDIGRELKLTIIDTLTGNSCWGHARVEDKIPPILTCPPNVSIVCGTGGTTPAQQGVPGVYENCGTYSLTYKDEITYGDCIVGYDQIIKRTWTAEDAYGNKSSCMQFITINLLTLFDVTVPPNFDEYDRPALSCEEKIDTSKNITPHLLSAPLCMDGYLLDSIFWLANPLQPNIWPNRRIPRVLGWNCIDSGEYKGHPSPFPIYYPPHRDWSPTNPRCWGPNRHIMWAGTGTISGDECKNIGITYRDIRIDLATPGCDAGPVGCFKILRQWTVLDWCTSEIGGHTQIIKVIDREGPQVLYPDTLTVNMEVWRCRGIWEVAAPWLIDNCSNETHYSVDIDDADAIISGNEVDGFVVTNINRGVHDAYIIAVDCCGNITKKRIAINVPDNVPPVAVCDKRTVVSITGNQSPGENYTKVFAENLDNGSFDNCTPHVFFKAIRMEELLGTNNGSTRDNLVSCGGLNGDDDPDPVLAPGNQIYFDDFVKFCCADVGNTVMVVLRVFDVEPGNGPIHPRRMNQGGNLFNRYSDCMVEVEVQDKAIPTVIAPPDIVVSCWFWFDIDKVDDPNDNTFGKVVTDLSTRAKVKTIDLLCYNYCVRNDITGYPGFINGIPPHLQPAPNKACTYYREFFDTAHAERKYELVWGFDGYTIGSCGANATISVSDLRECVSGKNITKYYR
ncbi:MAG: HYR domain-containing protein [Bacteroidota bacterium]|nr:HYR domain-containing protein [Bacteroidota bacterium]